MRRRAFLGGSLAAFAGPRKIAVISHRGEHLRHPENTLPAIRAAVDAGVDYVELDVRTTRDGALVLMHNATVDSRTDGKGRVADLTLAEIRKLNAGVGFSPTPVPSFEEALQALGRTCGLYLDWKAAPADAIAAALRRQRMVERTVVYGPVESLAALKQIEPAVRVMPEAVSAPHLRRLLAELAPRVVAFDHRDFQDELIAIARGAGADVFVDRLGQDDNEAAWADAVRRGATGIQTDRPAELVAFLKRL